MRIDLAVVGLAAFVGVTAIMAGATRWRPTRPWLWWFLAATLAVHGVATLVDAWRLRDITDNLTMLASVNIGHSVAGLMGLVALRELLFGRLPRQSREAAVDAGIVALAVGLVIWAVGYDRGAVPVDLVAGAVVLVQVAGFGAILRMAFSGALAVAAGRWLVATVVMVQASIAWTMLGSAAGPQWPTTLLWGLSLLCPGMAALSGSMRDLSAPVSGDHPQKQVSAHARMMLLGAGLVAVPLAMMLGGGVTNGHQLVLAAGLLVTGLAVAGRMLGLVHQRDAAVAELQAVNVELEQLAGEDALTGLPNRRRFQQVMHDAVARYHAGGAGVALLLIDLDRFKLINDGIGHAAGDALLVAVARRLDSAVRADDMVARLGGDEFAVVCHDVPDAQVAYEVAERVSEALNGAYEFDHHRYHMTGSLGVALAAGPDVTADELLRNADVAMYQAKQHGRARVEQYNHAVEDRSARRLRLANALPDALARDELVIAYQPEVDLRDGTTLWTEALLRWRHPTEGLLTPDAFLDIAEETGEIVPFGHWVLRQACAQLVWWQQRHPESAPTTVAVNFSSRQLADPDLISTVRDVLGSTGLDPQMLWLEITETSMMQEPELVAGTLAELKQLGVGVALDDFGTGYSSLAYLKQFPVDALKIDRSFVAGMTRDPQDRMIVSAVTSLAHSFGLLAVAEGVETAAQLAELRHLGCDFAQGYLWSEPLERDAFTAWMTSRTAKHVQEPRQNLGPEAGRSGSGEGVVQPLAARDLNAGA
jgi:diguanylate cyclase (GGDEF)-like protein